MIRGQVGKAENLAIPNPLSHQEAKIWAFRVLPRDLLLLPRSEMMAMMPFVCVLDWRPCSSDICPLRMRVITSPIASSKVPLAA